MTHTSLETFFALHPVFTVEEADHFLDGRHGGHNNHGGPANPATRQALLKYYQKQGRLYHIRRGLYAVAPPSQEQGLGLPDGSAFASADTFLIASRLTADAVLAYHTALELHGLAHSLREERIILSQQKCVRPLLFADIKYRAVLPPSALPVTQRMTVGVETRDRQGLTLRLTGIERTLVDILDRPALVGGWEEVWHTWQSVDVALDFPLLIRYVRLLGNATTAAKLGHALEASREHLAVPAAVLEELHGLAPHQAHPVERGLRTRTRLIGAWNLLIPAADFAEPFTDYAEPFAAAEWAGQEYQEGQEHRDVQEYISGQEVSR